MAFVTKLLVGSFEKIDPDGVAKLNLEPSVVSNGGKMRGCKAFGTTATRENGNTIGYQLNDQGGLTVEVVLGEEYSKLLKAYQFSHQSRVHRNDHFVEPITIEKMFVDTLKTLMMIAQSSPS
jgi:hypothetical protein